MVDAFNTFSNFVNLICANQAENAVDPLYEALSTIGPYAIGVVLVLMIFWGIIMGIRMAKAEDSKERASHQKALINGLIGLVAIFVLITILYAIRGPLVSWMNS